MILSRDRLSNILSILGTSVGNKVMHVADYVQFKADRERGKLLISSTDFNAFLTVDYGHDPSLDLTGIDDVFLIDYRKLTTIIKASTTEDVEIIDGDATVTVRTNGEYKFEKYGSPSDFPQIDFNYVEAARWEVSHIQSAWDKAVVAVSKDVTKMSYQGVNYDGNFAATDNRRLGVVEGPGDYDGSSMLIPPIFGSIIKHCKNQISVGPNSTGNLLIVTCEEVGLVASVRLLEAKFQDYLPLIESRSGGTRITVPKHEFIGAAGRLMVFTDELFKVVKMAVSTNGSKVQLDMTISNRGEGGESIGVVDANVNSSDESPTIEFSYNLNNLLEGASVVDSSDSITFDFQDNGFLWIEEGNFHYLLTPVIE